MNHGIEITRVYKEIEYSPDPCFKEIVDARRLSDSAPHIGNIQKLIGNSMYGFVLMRKDLHTDIGYCKSEKQVYKYIVDIRYLQVSTINT